VAVSRRSARPRYTLLLLVLASATIITLNYRGDLKGATNGLKSAAHDVISPVQSGVDSVLRPVGNFFEGAVNYGSLESQNQKLIEQNTRLRSEALETSRLQQENRQLRSAFGLPPSLSAIPSVPAQVVATTPSNFSDAVVIDKGSDSGIAKGMPVLSGQALVGRVVSVSHRQSTVLLITDPTSSVDVRFGPAGNVGVAVGQGAGRPLSVEYVFPSPTVHPSQGETMFTSGLSDAAFPGDIPVGRVSSVSLSSTVAAYSIALRPVANVSTVQFVTVLQWSGTS
jgi:rod shape-determining protein MreC